MIEDDELRSLYKTASANHLEKIEAGLLHLEKNPQDQKKLEEILRHAHSLKGDSRMLGVQDAETLTHHLEEVLIGVKKGTHQFSPAVFQALLNGLDVIRRIAREAVTGEPANVSIFHAVAELLGALDEGAGEDVPIFPVSLPDDQDIESLLVGMVKSQPQKYVEELIEPQTIPTVAGEPEPQIEIETVRIDLAELDDLLQYAGEIALTQQRLTRQLDLVRTLNALWEECQNKGNESRENILYRMGEILPKLQTNLENDTNRLQVLAEQLGQDIRELQLLPLSTVFNLFPRTVRDIAKSQNKEVDFTTIGGENLVDRKILEEIKAPLTHLIRNAVDHGIETPTERMAVGKSPIGKITLTGKVRGNEIIIEVVDDGRGLSIENIKQKALDKGIVTSAELAVMSREEIQNLIFRPGFSTKNEVTEISGRGVGLDVVKEMIDRVGEQIKIESQVGRGCTFRLILRANRSIIPTLVVRSGDGFYSVPIDYVVIALLLKPEDIITSADQPHIIWQEQSIPITFLSDLLQQPRSMEGKQYPCVIVQTESKQALIVDAIIDYQEAQIKALPEFLKSEQLLGVTILSDGNICYVLNIPALFAQKHRTISSSLTIEKPPLKLLLVEDSVPIRIQLRRILEKAGYIVTTAVDGLEGLQKFQDDVFDLVVSDVEMPNLTGLEMTQKIREFNSKTPIVLVTTLAKAEDRARALQAGANGYITKGDFQQDLLLQTLRELIT